MYKLIFLIWSATTLSLHAKTEFLHSKNSEGRIRIRPYFVSEFPAKEIPTEVGKSEPVDYIIITTEGLREAWEPLRDWKREKGMNCVIRTIEWIDENYGGGDTQERIRNFLRDAYNEWGTQYVLLGGDVDKVPTRHVISNNMYSPYYIISCDYYYSCLNGSWNANQNGMWGEVSKDSCDFTPSLSVGRLFASTPEDVAVNIDKIIKYEKNPDTVGLEKVLFISDSSHASHCEQIAEYFPEHFVKDFLFPPNFVRDSVMAFLNRNYGNVYVTLHGGTHQGWALDESNFLRPDADALRCEFFFMVCISCYVHWIDLDCVSRHLMLNPEGGSFAYLGSSRVGWFTEELQYNKRLYEGIFDSLYSIGEATGFAKRKTVPFFKSGSGEVSNNHRDVVLSYVLAGDPALKIWQHIPDSFVVTFPLNVGVGEQEFKVTVKNKSLAPVESAIVCVSRKNEVYARGYTNAFGEIIFEVCPESRGTMKITVVKDEFLPYEGYISINPGSPYVRYKGHFIDGNGLAESGKKSKLSVALENTGPLTAYDVQCKISSSSPYVTFKDSIIGYGDIPASWNRTKDYQLQIDKNCPDEEVILNILAYYNNDTTRDTFSLWVHAPKLSHFSHSYVALPGDTAGIYIKIKNDCSTGAINVTARLSSCIPGITVIDSIFEIGSVLPHKVQKIKNLFRFVGDTIPEFTLELSDSLAHIWQDTFQVVYINPPIDLLCIGGEYKITVQWKADSLVFPRGYNIYRAPDSVLLNSTLIKENPVWDDTRLDPYKSYFYWVTAVDSFLNESDFSEKAEGRVNPGLKNGWPQKVVSEFLAGPVCGELTPLSPGLEVVVNGGSSPYIYAWSADGKGVLSPDGVFADSVGQSWSAPALGDIDGDSILEIVSAEFWTGNRIFAHKSDGTMMPGFPFQLVDDYGSNSYPTLQDLDNDGKLEIIIVGYTGGSPGNWLFVFRADGSGFINSDGRFALLYKGHQKHNSQAAADINGDGALNIVVGCIDSLYAFNIDASRVSGWPSYINGTPTYPAIGDIDTSYPGLETVIHTSTGWAYLFHADGTLADGWPQSCPTTAWCVMSAPVLGDIDGDGTLEIALAGNDCFYVWEKDGANLPGWPVKLPTMSSVSVATPIIGDVDGDDDMEVIGTTHMGDIYAFHSDGSVVWGFPIAGNGKTDGTPVLKDIDFDGQNELVVATRDAEVKVWKVLGTKVEWGELAHDRWHTGLYGFVPPDTFNLSISEEQITPNLSWGLKLISPNPFTKATAIYFSVPINNQGKLTIYDLGGRVIKQFNNLTNKNSPVVWDAKDTPSGVYFIRLTEFRVQSSEFRVQTKKVILVR